MTSMQHDNSFDPFWDNNLMAPRFAVITRSPDAEIETEEPVPQPQQQPLKSQDEMRRQKDFHFSVVRNPTKPTSRKEMKAIRKHVMKHFFTVNDGDPRAKRQRVSIAPTMAFRRSDSRMNSEESVDTDVSTRTSPLPKQSRAVVPAQLTHADMHSRKRKSTITESDYAVYWKGATNVLYQPVYTSGTQTLYMATNLTALLPRRNMCGNTLNPFNSWPSFCRPEVEIERLKWLCMRCFKSEGLEQTWIPHLVRTAVAFYSTTCISSAHDDAMIVELHPDRRRPLAESYQRLAVRDGVLKMINQNLELGIIDDGTIIAVLHVLISELITGNRVSIETHLKGLTTIIKRRGQFPELGENGFLAVIVTVVAHLVSVFTGDEPEPLYTGFASQSLTEPPSVVGIFPENPLYFTPNFVSTLRTSSINISFDPMLYILELAQQASEAFVQLHDMSGSISTIILQDNEQAAWTLHCARDKIFAIHSAAALSNKAIAAFETVRLVARVYVDALHRCIPFSQAAKLLEHVSIPHEAGKRCDSVFDLSESEEKPMLLQIRDALRYTDMDNIWGARRGVLLWAGFVALSASTEVMELAADHSFDAEVKIELVAARQFVSAVVIRCAIRHIFENTRAILGLMKRLIAINQVLENSRAGGGHAYAAIITKQYLSKASEGQTKASSVTRQQPGSADDQLQPNICVQQHTFESACEPLQDNLETYQTSRYENVKRKRYV